MDADPSIRITLTKAGKTRTFDIGRSTTLRGYWAMVETGERPRLAVVAEDRALALRQEIDAIIGTLLEDGWTPA